MSDRAIQPEDYRPYQVEGRDAAFGEFEGGTDSTLVVMPTGTGKTVLSGMCVERAIADYNRKALFLAHREVLNEQAFETMAAFGFSTALEMNKHDALAHAAAVGQPDVVVGSLQTMQDDRLIRWPNRSFGLIIIDECHRALTDQYTKLLNWFEGYWLIGITATPKRGDRRNLGARFETKAYEYSLRRAIRERYLVPIKTRTVPIAIDLRGIKMAGGDFSVGELEERIIPKLEVLARAFLNEIGDRPAVAFLPDVASSMAFAEVCNKIRESEIARYVAGTAGEFGMTKPERKANLDAYKAGAYQVVTCCELLIEGWDAPRVSAVGIIRPTLQQYRYAQMVGRGTRLSPKTGKEDLLVVDFDWETDAECKDLCSTVDLFDDGSIDEEVYAVAKGLSRERSGLGDVDAGKLIDDAERIVRTRHKLMIRLTGKEAKYEALTHDPVGVGTLLDIKMSRKHDFDRLGTNPASERQRKFLAGLGVQAPENLSKWGASKLIDKLQKRRQDGLASVSDVQKLLSSGVYPDLARVMTAEQAAEAISTLEATRPKSQASFLF